MNSFIILSLLISFAFGTSLRVTYSDFGFGYSASKLAIAGDVYTLDFDVNEPMVDGQAAEFVCLETKDDYVVGENHKAFVFQVTAEEKNGKLVYESKFLSSEVSLKDDTYIWHENSEDFTPTRLRNWHKEKWHCGIFKMGLESESKTNFPTGEEVKSMVCLAHHYDPKREGDFAADYSKQVELKSDIVRKHKVETYIGEADEMIKKEIEIFE
mmetsp:Transcript_29919/g.26474  ORF Transcript_29919/g.26474 Transcript_29919/m.26474 type:complete len:212 (-) Transcript_29919:42-677(-)